MENISSDYLKGIFKESNIFLLQRQPKNLLRLFSNPCIYWNSSLPKGIFKCSDKRYKIRLFYLIEFLNLI